MAKTNKDYFGLNYILSVILAIIPVTAWVCGFVTRFKERKYFAGVIRVIPLCGLIIWIVDLCCMIAKGKIWRLLNC